GEDVYDQAVGRRGARVLRVARAWISHLDRARLAARFRQPLPLAQGVPQYVAHHVGRLSGVFVGQQLAVGRETVDPLAGIAVLALARPLVGDLAEELAFGVVAAALVPVVS